MRSEDPEVIQLELKYCERCGALWLRLRGAQQVFCAPCELEVMDLPAPRNIISRPRLPGNHKIEVKNQCPTTLSGNAFQLAGPPRSCRTAAKMGPDLEGRGHDPDLWLYRDRTLGLLRRYQRLSVQSGRLPSLLSRELFRTRVTSYRTTTLEDTVIFVHDVARGRGETRFVRQPPYRHDCVPRLHPRRNSAPVGLPAAYGRTTLPGSGGPVVGDFSAGRAADPVSGHERGGKRKVSRGQE